MVSDELSGADLIALSTTDPTGWAGAIDVDRLLVIHGRVGRRPAGKGCAWPGCTAIPSPGWKYCLAHNRKVRREMFRTGYFKRLDPA